MQRCIELARLSNGYNRPNPEVGSVIVYQGRIIGEGWHARYGQGHAEVNAVASVKDKSLLATSTIYVTLEPCFHFGKTPPCVDLILKHEIPRVVIGSSDPYHEVAGRSIEKLRNAGVEVLVDVLKTEVEWLNRRFFTNVRKERPYIILKYAASADGFMGKKGENVRISGPLTQRLLHRWRAEEAAILVGTNTAAVDNPQLGNRLYFGPQPLRVVLDKNLRLPANLRLFDGDLSTLVFTEKVEFPNYPNTNFEQLDFAAPDFLKDMMTVLQKRRVASVLVEGGAQLLQSFLSMGFWDEARVFRSKSVSLQEGIAAPIIPPHHLKAIEDLNTDFYELYVNKASNF